MKRGSRKLLIGKPEWSVTDKGITWVTDRFVLARADALKSLPASLDPLPVKAIRGVLTDARQSPDLGRAFDTNIRIRRDRTLPLLAIVGKLGGPVAAVQESAWRAWCLTDTVPHINAKGQLLWYATVRGKRALFGVVMPVRLSGYDTTTYVPAGGIR